MGVCYLCIAFFESSLNLAENANADQNLFPIQQQ